MNPPSKLAGLVLGLLAPLTYGATGPWAVVLSAEWLGDRVCGRSAPHGVTADWVGFLLGAGGAAYFVAVSISLWNYSLGDFWLMIRLYWIVFFAWLNWRAFTRWRGITAHLRAASDLTPR